MSSFLLAPIGLAAAALIPALLLLYFLKLRRTQVIIPSTFLWRKSMRDLTANAPFQRLRANLLMFLQIIVLALLTLALARPFIAAEGLSGDNFCVVIDCSASMSAREEETTRLDLAKLRARDLIDALGNGDRMMLVAFSHRTEVVCELTDDKPKLQAALNTITPSHSGGHVRDVLQLIRSLAPDNPDVPGVISGLQVMLLSDGKVTDPQALRDVSVPLTYMRIGSPLPNLGLVTFSTRSNEQTNTPQALVAVQNSGNEDTQAALTLLYEDSVLAVEEVTVPAGKTTERLFELPALDPGVLMVELEPTDALAADNGAWLVIQPEMRTRVLFVGAADDPAAVLFQRAFTLDPTVDWAVMEPPAFAELPQPAEITIFASSPPTVLPAGTLIFVDVAAMEGVTRGESVDTPPILSADRAHPVMRFLEFQGVGVQRASTFALPETARVLLSGSEAPLIADISRGGQNMLLLTFRPEESNWPLQLSFPLFVQNLLGWRGQASEEVASYSAGAAVTMPATETDTIAHITLPSGGQEEITISAGQPAHFAGTGQAGVYTVQAGESVTRFAVNLLDKNESDLTPAHALPLGEGSISAASGEIRFNYEIWPWLAAAGLAFLVVEWFLYARKAWI